MHYDIISLFDRSGVMVKPWRDAGYSTLTIDIESARHDGPSLQADALDLPPLSADIVFAFPPCTHLAGSGARWWEAKGPRALEEALSLVDAARRLCDTADYWMLENPVGRLSTHWRKPDWTFNPCEYAGYSDESEAYTKKTCIWSNFDKPPTKPLPPTLGSKMHRIPPGPDRQFLRSLTPRGFAIAVFLHLTNATAGHREVIR